MTADRPPAARARAEFTAVQSGAYVDRPLVVSVMQRVRNRIATRELASYGEKADAWNRVVAALRDGERLRQEYYAALIKSENLPLLRAAEEAKILNEVQAIFDNEADRQKLRKLDNLRLDADIIRAQRALDVLNKKPGDVGKENRAQARMAAIKRIRQERDEMIATIMDGRKAEDLTDEDRALIDDLHLFANHEIKKLFEVDA